MLFIKNILVPEKVLKLITLCYTKTCRFIVNELNTDLLQLIYYNIKVTMCIDLSIFLFIYLFIYLSIYLFIYLSQKPTPPTALNVENSK